MISCLTDFADRSEQFGKVFLRLAFFILNLVMLWLCIVDLE